MLPVDELPAQRLQRRVVCEIASDRVMAFLHHSAVPSLRMPGKNDNTIHNFVKLFYAFGYSCSW